MGTSAVQYRIMPSGLDVNLNELKTKITALIKNSGGVPHSVEEQPVAFGIKALIVSFAYPEQKEIDELGNKLSKIHGISSAELTDYRRAVG